MDQDQENVATYKGGHAVRRTIRLSRPANSQSVRQGHLKPKDNAHPSPRRSPSPLGSQNHDPNVPEMQTPMPKTPKMSHLPKEDLRSYFPQQGMQMPQAMPMIPGALPTAPMSSFQMGQGVVFESDLMGMMQRMVSSQDQILKTMVR